MTPTEPLPAAKRRYRKLLGQFMLDGATIRVVFGPSDGLIRFRRLRSRRVPEQALSLVEAYELANGQYFLKGISPAQEKP